jgi:aminoglycoside 3-N-acetyltransferase
MFSRLTPAVSIGSRVARRLLRMVKPYSGPLLSEDEVRTALFTLLGCRAPILFVHSSLSACGRIRGGAASVIRTLSANCELLVLPTHSYCYPTSFGELAPVFDRGTTPSAVGRITDKFWRQNGVSRSIHPTHSLAAVGPGQQALVSEHERTDTPCGIRTPYEKLVKLDSAVLMFGTTLNTYTLFHTAEDAAQVPYLYCPEPYDLRAIDSTGSILQIRMWRQDMSIQRRFIEMERELTATGMLRRSQLGRGTLLFLPSAKDVHEYMLSALRSDPFYLVSNDCRRRVEFQCAQELSARGC